MSTTQEFNKKPDFYDNIENCKDHKKTRINTNPRYAYFNQTHFTAGDVEQFEYYRDKTNSNLCPKDIDISNNVWKDKDIKTYIDWEKYRNIPAKAVDNTFHYIFNKFKKGIFIKILDNELKVFLPFSKVNFVNEWGDKVSIDSRFKNLNDLIEYVQTEEGRQFDSKRVNQFINMWYSNNCLVRFEYPLSEGDSGAVQMRDMFAQLLKNRKIPDIEFFVNRRDFPIISRGGYEPYDLIFGKDTPLVSHNYDKYSPILSMNTKLDYADIPIPTWDDWSRIRSQEDGVFFPKDCRDYRYDFSTPWEDKKNIAVFRGASTGCGTSTRNNIRLRLADIGKKGIFYKGKNVLDAGINKWNLRPRILPSQKGPLLTPIIKQNLDFETVEAISPSDQSKYKYVINVDGHSAAYRLSLELSMGSVILVADSPYYMWFKKFLEPYVHYIPIKRDLSDLEEKIIWCIEHDDECRQIAKNAKDFYNKYLMSDGAYDYLQNILINLKKEIGLYVYNYKSPTFFLEQNELKYVFKKNREYPTKSKDTLFYMFKTSSPNDVFTLNIENSNLIDYTENTELYFSKNISNYIKNLLQDIPDESYVVCPHFGNDYIQIGMTGTGKIDESNIESLVREVKEELGMMIEDVENIQLFEKIDKKNRVWTYAKINNFNPIKGPVPKNKLEDNKDNKIAAILYGDKDELLEKINKGIKMNSFNLTIYDDITAISIVRTKFLKYIIENIDTHNFSPIIENINKIPPDFNFEGLRWVLNRELRLKNYKIFEKGPQIFENKNVTIDEYSFLNYKNIFAVKTLTNDFKQAEFIHGNFIGLYGINDIINKTNIPNFIYTLYSDDKQCWMENAKGITLQKWIENKFDLQKYIWIIYQIGLSLKVAQNQCGFIHNDLAPWNIVIEELDKDISINYPISNTQNIEIRTKIIVKIIDYGKSHIVYNNIHHGINYFETLCEIHDIISLLLITINMIITNRNINLSSFEKTIIIKLFNFLGNSKYTNYKSFQNIGEIKKFTSIEKKFSNLISTNKYELENKTIYDFLAFIDNNFIQNKNTVIFPNNKLITKYNSNPIVTYNFVYAKNNTERYNSYLDVFYNFKKCSIPISNNSLLEHYIIQKSYLTLTGVIANCDRWFNLDKPSGLSFNLIDNLYKSSLDLLNSFNKQTLVKPFKSIELDNIDRFPKPFFNLSSFDDLNELLVLSTNIDNYYSILPKKYSKIIEVITFVLSYNYSNYNMNISTKNFYKNNLENILQKNNFYMIMASANKFTFIDLVRNVITNNQENVEKYECEQVKPILEKYKKILSLI